MNAADFLFGSQLGEGSYGRVIHAKMKETGAEYAVKIMEKRHIKKEKKVKFVMTEKNILAKISHPRIIKLHMTFQDKQHLFMVMELATGGELLDVIASYVSSGDGGAGMGLQEAHFYSAEIVLAIEYLHSMGYIHRDLKPENVLISSSGHIKLIDFGTAKDERDGAANAFCGTPEYVSPEVLRDQDAGRGCDLWAFGVIVFQDSSDLLSFPSYLNCLVPLIKLLMGYPCFQAENEYLIFQQILNHPQNFEFPSTLIDAAKDFIARLLVQDPAQRLGAGNQNSQNGFGALKDGASDDWMYANLQMELESVALAENLNLEPDSNSRDKWRPFLKGQERVLRSGLVDKRKGFFSKRRQLLLTSRPRLCYVHPVSFELKGEIPWRSIEGVELVTDDAFDVITPGRRFHFTALQTSAEEVSANQWVSDILGLLQ